MVKMSQFWPKSKAKAFDEPELKLDFDWRLKEK